MALIVFSAILILAIAFFQIVQGLFGALVMAVLTILSALLAFAVYPPLAELLYGAQPAYADAVALMASFIIPLLCLRVLADRFIPANVVLGVWPDRICGGLLGLLVGMVITGVLAVAAQLLPFGPVVMTYRPFDDTLRRTSALAPFYCDEFVLGSVKALSAGSLSALSSGSSGADRQFGRLHDDLLLEAYCARNTAEKFGRTEAPVDSLKRVEFYNAPDTRLAAWRDDVPRNHLLGPAVIDKMLIVRCQIDYSARDEADGQDVVQRWRLPATHFRLVSKTGASYYPLAYLTYDSDGWAAHPAAKSEPGPDGLEAAAQIGKLIVIRPVERDQSLIVDWVYRVPIDEEPRYVVFRRLSRAAPGDKQDHTDQPNLMPPNADALNRKPKAPPAPGR